MAETNIREVMAERAAECDGCGHLHVIDEGFCELKADYACDVEECDLRKENK